MLKGIHKARVENNIDPNNEQRIQIRVLALHNFDEKEAPKECLPWALPVLPPSDGKIDGGYGVFDVPDIGDWVWVFFEDEYMFNPHYFGTIRTEKDTNPKYIQGVNKFIKDRWDNEVLIDKEKILITKNNGHIIEMHDDFIKIMTKGGNDVLLSDKDKNITIKTDGKNQINIDDNTQSIKVNNYMGTSIEMTASGKVLIATADAGDIAVGGNKLIAWLGAHTHIGNLGVSTSPAENIGDLGTILYQSINYIPATTGTAEGDAAVAKANESTDWRKNLEDILGADAFSSDVSIFEDEGMIDKDVNGTEHATAMAKYEVAKKINEAQGLLPPPPPQLSSSSYINEAGFKAKRDSSGNPTWQMVTIHCTASLYGTREQILSDHIARGFGDIGYHFMVGNGCTTKSNYNTTTDGLLITGRPLTSYGCHAPGWNNISCAISLFGVGKYTQKQQITLFQQIKALMIKYNMKDKNGKTIETAGCNAGSLINGHCETTSGKAQGKPCPVINMDRLRSTFQTWIETGKFNPLPEFQYEIIDRTDATTIYDNKFDNYTYKIQKGWQKVLKPYSWSSF